MAELSEYAFETLREDREFALYRARQPGNPEAVLVLAPIAAQPTPANLERLEREYSLAVNLDRAWAALPLALVRHEARPMLVFEDPGGEPLDKSLGRPLELPRFLNIAIALAAALRQVHRNGLIHKDIKPANVLVDAHGNVKLTGFGMASRLPRERQAPTLPEVIAGTFAYMAPEQTGRMNRSIDARSDLYSLGITLYELLTGVLPFTASDPLEWIHCHVARHPKPPSGLVRDLPAPVEAIVLKLLRKNAEDRYQTAAGVERDLRRCLAALTAQTSIELFPLGERDAPDRLLVPEKLYGREAELDALIAAFERVATRGATERILVSGSPGIGKSSLVNELHKVLVLSRGLFAAGKFDQYKRDIPYATLAQAFQSLVRQLLGKRDAELKLWRQELLEALGPNGELMVNLIPELALIIGEQPPVADLPPLDAQNRFFAVFRRFLGVFAQPEHPLVLFLDDMQWLDMATIKLIERIVREPEIRSLMIICAYRDDEVDPQHPFMRLLATVAEARGEIKELRLGPLSPNDVARLTADALRAETDRVRPLADLIFSKTEGNPYFTIQFLTTLADEGLIILDPDTSAWLWDLDRIRAKGITDNVAVLMAAKVRRLPDDTLDILKYFACLGNSAPTATLAMVVSVSEDQVHAAMQEAVCAGLVYRLDDTYAFAHDRVQEATYALIADGERAETHLHVGRILVSRTPPDEIEEKIFDIVNHLNRAAELLPTSAEREQLAELNLVAGKRAKAAMATASALTHFAAGEALLSSEAWERSYPLAFALALQRTESEYLTGDFSAVRERLTMLSERARTLADQAALTRLGVEFYTNSDQPDRAVEMGLNYLRLVGIEWSPHPTDEEVTQELARTWELVGDRPIEDLIDLPPMTDPGWRATLEVLNFVHAPANFTDGNLVSLVISRMANISLEHGHGDGSGFSFVYLGMLLGWRFNDYRAGFRFGKLGIDLAEQGEQDRFKARALQNFGNSINPWARPIRSSFDIFKCALERAQEASDLTFMAYAYMNTISARLVAGDPLGEVAREAEASLAFVRHIQFGTGADLILGHLGLVHALRGETPALSSFSHAGFDEHAFEQHLEADPALAMAACWYWIRKLQGFFLAGSTQSALAAAAKAEALLWTSPAFLVQADYHFYAALARAAQYDAASDDERIDIPRALEKHRKQIEIWAGTCPENFQTRYALVCAEIARIDGRALDAERHYEEAIRSARRNGFAHNEGLASELAANFYKVRGFDTIAHAYLSQARSCYVRWGADGKVRQMDRGHPHLHQEPAEAQFDSTGGTPVERLDLATVVRVMRSVSSEIDLKKLIDTLMVTALEHAGGDRGVLVLLRGDELSIEAEATTVRENVEVRLRQAPVSAEQLPDSIVRYVARTQDTVLLEDASDQNHPFSADEYITQNACRSILCVPLIKQNRLTGVLYIENSLTTGAFTPSRTGVLRLLASQAAISLENARLYTELQRAESYLAEAQRLSHMGSWAWNISTNRIALSEEHCRIFGISREQLDSTYEVALEAIHAEDRPRVRLTVEDAIRSRSDFSCEFRIVLPDGSIKHLHSRGTHTANDAGDIHEYVGTVMDITERKRGEYALRDAQAELAHVTRLTTMGELTASIAHEVNQPLTAIAINAQACMRWLATDQPDIDEARKAADRIVRSSHHAGDVIRSILAMSRKSSPQMAQLRDQRRHRRHPGSYADRASPA